MLPKSSQCTGCGTCAATCPVHCIQMTTDREGFRYPVIDQKQCLHCGLCETRCPILTFNTTSDSFSACAFAAQIHDQSIRSQSSSGGVFSALALHILSIGGAVCAAMYDSDFRVIHTIIRSPAQISALRGAKYAQSQAEHCFPEIKALLETGIPVMFVGTPCQVAGLDCFLSHKYPNLLLVDMICHGVPSPTVWSQYLDARKTADASGADIQSINLRSKATGWSKYRYSVSICYANGASYNAPQSLDPFMQGFVNNLYLRPSCSDCHFKGLARGSDLTLGDYWGVWEQYPEFDDDKGTSIILVNSSKGSSYWQQIAHSLNAFPVSLQHALKYNPSATESAPSHPKRKQFFNRFQKKPFDRLISNLLNTPVEMKHIIKILLTKLRRM